MINANELRIGNLLSYASGDIFIVTYHDIKIISEWTSKIAPLPNPIPITEELLLKAGFQKYLGFYKCLDTTHGRFLEVSINNDNGTIQYYCYYRQKATKGEDDYVLLRKDLQYIHQLQNLYFALTGEELTFNL